MKPTQLGRALGIATSTGGLTVLLLTAGCTAVPRERDGETLGMDYHLQLLDQPRPNRVHVLRVDLRRGQLHPAVVLAEDPDGEGPAEAALTDPFKLARDPSVVAFVNTNPWDSLPDAQGVKNRRWFEGQPVDIQGLAVSGRQGVRSRALPGEASVWVTPEGQVVMGDASKNPPVREGMAGFQPIVRAGVVVAAPGGPLHPRTALGVDQRGVVLWLVVVDGRQPKYSEGMSLEELGGVLRDLGCWHAVNMDGGGSSVMGMPGPGGEWRVVNSPSDRRLGKPAIRPLPMILTIRER